MTTQNLVPCDGCGQSATTEHIARRLQRLEWTTRYRPLHINTILLSAVSPSPENEFLYASPETFKGEALIWLAVAGIDPRGKTPETIHAEFQKAGFLLTYVLECPLEASAGNSPTLGDLLDKRIAATATRIRRSFKPKRVALVSPDLTSYLPKLSSQELPCTVILDGDLPFSLTSQPDLLAVARLRDALAPGLGAR